MIHRKVITIGGREVGAHRTGNMVTICPAVEVAKGEEFTYADKRLRVLSSRDPYGTYKTRPDPAWSEQRMAEWQAAEDLRNRQNMIDRSMAGKFLELTVEEVADPGAEISSAKSIDASGSFLQPKI
ncbi:MAG: hypothetical protein MI806_26025 [Minwuiales bacterium]|nr:hypothetical protein [Minwuiales bacterium]